MANWMTNWPLSFLESLCSFSLSCFSGPGDSGMSSSIASSDSQAWQDTQTDREKKFNVWPMYLLLYAFTNTWISVFLCTERGVVFKGLPWGTDMIIFNYPWFYRCWYRYQCPVINFFAFYNFTYLIQIWSAVGARQVKMWDHCLYTRNTLCVYFLFYFTHNIHKHTAVSHADRLCGQYGCCCAARRSRNMF